MLIEYKGEKPSKTLNFNHKEWGIQTVTWDEFNGKIAEVTDQEFLRFLLHPDRKGLFSRVEKREEVKSEKPDAPVVNSTPEQLPAPSVVSNDQLVDPVTATPAVVKTKPGPKKKVS